MRSYNHLYEKLFDKDYIIQCINDAAKGKTNRHIVKRVLSNVDYHVDQIIKILKEGSFKIRHHKPVYINESSCKKVRKIIQPDFMYEQIIQHMIVGILQPIFMRSMHPHSCASIPGRGSSYGCKIINCFIKYKCDKTKSMYVLKFDIRKFFDHIDRKILMDKLSKIIRDKHFLHLLSILVFYDNNNIGIPLGFYSSQWFANFYLMELDYYITQTLKCGLFIRYMDDVVIMDSNKRKLHEMQKCIIEYLTNKLHLTIKHNHQIFRFVYFNRITNKEHGRFIDFMGFKFYHNRMTLRKSTLCNIRKKINRLHSRVHKRIMKVNWYIACQLISRMGWLKRTKTYGYYRKYMKPKINVTRLRQLISKHCKYMNKLHERNEMRYDELLQIGIR